MGFCRFSLSEPSFKIAPAGDLYGPLAYSFEQIVWCPLIAERPPIGSRHVTHRILHHLRDKGWYDYPVTQKTGLPSLVERPSFLDQHALLNPSPPSLFGNLIGNMRHNFRMHLTGSRAWKPTTLACRLPREKAVLFGSYIRPALGLGGYVLSP